jgi:hypothetical protein
MYYALFTSREGLKLKSLPNAENFDQASEAADKIEEAQSGNNYAHCLWILDQNDFDNLQKQMIKE